MTKSGLGRGLASLIPNQSSNLKEVLSDEADFLISDDKILQVDPKKIKANPHQPRQNIQHHDLEELIESIKEYGIIQPLVVTKEDNEYQLIAGERRLRSAEILELKTVPVIVRQAQEVEKLEIALIENVQRKNLNPIEQAIAYQKLIDEFNFTQEQVAQKIGKSRSSVSNLLRLLNLPVEIQKSLAEGKINEGHAKAILAFDEPKQQMKMFHKIVIGGLTVRDVEQEAKTSTIKKTKINEKDLALQQQEKVLRDKLSTKVEIKKSARGGKIIIEFYSKEDLDRIISQIK
ncbi:MAG: ParB/RepB/Spo0J family partition protein [Patescibacteria group bacterium]|jgi:ParB family chromosome partitioning protein|nr:ParB/RepB/Spo0J family partition protein [Patescibacteria group bacterium]